MKTIPTLEATVARMKSEIQADQTAGIVPQQVPNFSALHDYVDANEYGGFCDDDFLSELWDFYGAASDDGCPAEVFEFINAAQNQIDKWLADCFAAWTHQQ